MLFFLLLTVAVALTVAGMIVLSSSCCIHHLPPTPLPLSMLHDIPLFKVKDGNILTDITSGASSIAGKVSGWLTHLKPVLQ